ncbi:hypothetical protein LUZ63_018643 [Rhynchospora breviuscula]|uniref:EF-hand domain-containing protein n=1 Tax=Rhynchospora breviuscula TaxID=2022672 RepID=A0A9Q0HIL2_9POAL|nr:hypothetical protein LUZ63_018643 [Rhynchospora breviuscula]
MMAEMDKDRSGALDFDEFLYMMTAKTGDEELMKAFRIIDHDKNGKISIRDIQNIARDLGESFTMEEIREMVQEADENGDGEVDKEEFLRIMRQTRYG